MNLLVTIITGLHVLAHSIFGCCADHWIHEPGEQPTACCDDIACSDHDAVHSHNESHDHGHGPGAGDELAIDGCGENDDTPGQQHRCSHENCQWVTSKGDSKVDLGANGFYSPAPSHVSAIGTIPTPSGRSLEGDGARCFAPALRSHLRLGVLLI